MLVNFMEKLQTGRRTRVSGERRRSVTFSERAVVWLSIWLREAVWLREMAWLGAVWRPQPVPLPAPCPSSQRRRAMHAERRPVRPRR
jgi:hypothetical protein